MVNSDGLPIFTNDYHKINPERSKNWGFLSLASVPIISKEKVIGALNIASKSRYSFTNEEKELFSFACREMGNIISKLHAEEALRESEKNYRESYNRAEFYKDLFAKLFFVPYHFYIMAKNHVYRFQYQPMRNRSCFFGNILFRHRLKWPASALY